METTHKADLICVAAVAGAHGVRGLVKLKTFTEFAEDVASYGPLLDDKGKIFDVEFRGVVKGAVLAQLSGVSDRNQAQEMRGTKLFVERALLPELEEEDEFYAHDLVGLPVQDPEGGDLGKVVAVHNFGAGDILEFGKGKKTEMISFTQSYVPEVDLEGGHVIVRMPDVVLAQGKAEEVEHPEDSDGSA
ncbi:ribosome maturation factor RimM [Kiloniella sp. b19]|uniref:ribosome maturation factor RimM n=1 Tax=Kiloniella sp. GXU_MW_B19 TaxID=3141326 RepID=UPI0031D03210